MGKVYTITGENVNNSFFHLLVEIHAKQMVIMDMNVEILSKITEQPVFDLKLNYELMFQKLKSQCRRDLQTYFAGLKIEDFLDDGKE